MKAEEVAFACLKNMGHDVTCGTCMSIAFTGGEDGHPHTCKQANGTPVVRCGQVADLRRWKKVTVVIPEETSQSGMMYSFEVPQEVADYIRLCERVRLADELTRNEWGKAVADFVRGYKILKR